jgi:hypothetical protein
VTIVGSPSDWQAWAPPLSPPATGGLPADQAQDIADAVWADEPHLAAALMWEAYAATLDPTHTVAQVATGSQSVSYSPAMPGGQYGLAISRAQWHRSFLDALVSVPLLSPRDQLADELAGQLALPFGEA